MKVKLLCLYMHEVILQTQCCECGYLQSVILDSITDDEWKEVSEEEYLLVKNYVDNLNKENILKTNYLNYNSKNNKHPIKYYLLFVNPDNKENNKNYLNFDKVLDLAIQEKNKKEKLLEEQQEEYNKQQEKRKMKKIENLKKKLKELQN